MNKSFVFGMIASVTVVASATIWIVKRSIQPPTTAAKKRLTIILRFIAAQYVIITALVLLSVEHLLQPRLLGILGLVNFFGSFLVLWVAFKRTPLSDRDITREQRLRAVKNSKFLIAIYVFGLIDGLLHIRELPAVGIVVGVAVNILILIALITNLRRHQSKLNASASMTDAKSQ